MYLWKVEAFYKGHVGQPNHQAATFMVTAETIEKAVESVTTFDRANPTLGFDQYDFNDPVQIADDVGEAQNVVAFIEESVQQFL